MRRPHSWTLLFAAAAYILVGSATAVLSGMASSPTTVKAWRLAAWLLSLVVFVAHLAVERRRRVPSLSVARYVSGAVALGAMGVAAMGPLRAHWGEPERIRLALLSIVAWPILTGVPAFVVAFITGLLLDRVAQRPSDSPPGVA